MKTVIEYLISLLLQNISENHKTYQQSEAELRL